MASGAAAAGAPGAPTPPSEVEGPYRLFYRRPAAPPPAEGSALVDMYGIPMPPPREEFPGGVDAGNVLADRFKGVLPPPAVKGHIPVVVVFLLLRAGVKSAKIEGILARDDAAAWLRTALVEAAILRDGWEPYENPFKDLSPEARERRARIFVETALCDL